MRQPRLTPVAAAVRAVVQQWQRDAAVRKMLKEQEEVHDEPESEK